jgi:DNA topoisomerase-2
MLNMPEMTDIKTNREFKVLTDVEHVLLRPNMYIGGINPTTKEQWVLNKTTNKFEFKSVKIVPAILKCCAELLDNSIDVAIDTNFKAATTIKVNVTDTSIEVSDNGIGIPCVPPKGSTSKSPKDTCACVAWTTLKSGTSFDENRNKIGTNGVGASCVAVFSKKFVGKSDDGKYRQTITCKNNLTTINASKVEETKGKPGVTVYCEPDLARFNVTKIDDLHKDLIYQRILTLAISYPKISFYFNGNKVKVTNNSIPKYFSEYSVSVSSDNTYICVFPNEYDEFKQYSYVNGIDTFRGGSHVDYITNEICSRIKEKLAKKYKTIRPGDIKNKLALAVFFTNFNNPEFDAQTKESLSNSNAAITKHLDGKINFDVFAKNILKCNEIIEPIIETFKIKEELKARTEIKKSKKEKVKTDKYMSPFGQKKYLLICEGLSARGGLSSALGRNGYGYFAARGVPINGYDAKVQALVANQELKDIINILELDFFNKDNPNKTIAFDKIVLANDADNDGIFICSQYIGWFTKYAPNLFAEHKIARLITPLAVLRDSKDKITKAFYSLAEFKEYEKTHDLSKVKVEYKKGLGSWQQSDFINLFESKGFEYFLQDLELDEEGKVYVDDWLNTNKAEKRKEYLREFTLDTEML